MPFSRTGSAAACPVATGTGWTVSARFVSTPGATATALVLSIALAGCERRTAPAGAADLVPIEIELPDAAFDGTPESLRSDNLEPPRKGERPPFLAPKGTVNLALKKHVAASDEDPIIGEIEMVTDGDKKHGDGSFVELAPGLQHAQVDLGAEHSIRAVVLWHYHAMARIYHDVVIRVANDPDFLTGVTTLFNNDHDNSSGLGIGKDYEYVDDNKGKLVDAGGVKARYVRLYSNGSTGNEMNHYTEVEVYGLPAE